MTVHGSEETIQGRKLFAEIRYLGNFGVIEQQGIDFDSMPKNNTPQPNNHIRDNATAICQ